MQVSAAQTTRGSRTCDDGLCVLTGNNRHLSSEKTSAIRVRNMPRDLCKTVSHPLNTFVRSLGKELTSELLNL